MKLRQFLVVLCLTIGLSLGAFSIARAQDIEPRAYSNVPIGMNFLIAGYAYTQGAVPFDSALPVKNAQIKTQNAVLAYADVFDLFGQSVERNINDFGDPLLRLSVNLYGAPALILKEFRGYDQDLIVGASLQVSAPLGQYDSSKLVNLGLNLWAFKPELGISKALG